LLFGQNGSGREKPLKFVRVQQNPFLFSKAFIGGPGTTPQGLSLDDRGFPKTIAQFHVCYFLSAEYTQKMTEI
jgi:hypothetical protein